MGLISLISSCEQLFSLVHMYIGTHLTDHSARWYEVRFLSGSQADSTRRQAILRTKRPLGSRPSPDHDQRLDSGNDRRDPLLAIVDLLAEQAEAVCFQRCDSTQAFQQASVWYMALITTIEGAADKTDQLRIARAILAPALQYLAQTEGSKESGRQFAVPCADLLVSPISAVAHVATPPDEY